MELKDYQVEFKKTDRTDYPSKDMEILGACVGLCGESGEVANQIKQHVYHSSDLDRSKLINELGDVMWYVTKIANFYNLDMREVLDANIEKLKKRHPSGFSNEYLKKQS